MTKSVVITVLTVLVMSVIYLSIGLALVNGRLKAYENQIDVDDTIVYEVVGYSYDGHEITYLIYDDHNDVLITKKSSTILKIDDECVIIEGKLFKIE